MLEKAVISSLTVRGSQPRFNVPTLSEVLGLMQAELDAIKVVSRRTVAIFQEQDVPVKVLAYCAMLSNFGLRLLKDGLVWLEGELASFSVNEEQSWGRSVLTGFVSGTTVTWNERTLEYEGRFMKWFNTISDISSDNNYSTTWEGVTPDLKA